MGNLRVHISHLRFKGSTFACVRLRILVRQVRADFDAQLHYVFGSPKLKIGGNIETEHNKPLVGFGCEFEIVAPVVSHKVKLESALRRFYTTTTWCWTASQPHK